MPYIIKTYLPDSRAVSKDYYPKISDEFDARIVGPYEFSDEERQNFPHSLLVGKPSRGGVPDILGMSGGPFWMSQKVRDILEELEPGVLEFIPLQLKSKDDVPIQGKTEHGTYYLIFHPPMLDCLVVEETDFMDGRGYEGYGVKYASIKTTSTEAQCTLNAAVIAGHHFWRAAKPLHYTYFCSDEFYKRIKQEKIEGLDFCHKCDVKLSLV